VAGGQEEMQEFAGYLFSGLASGSVYALIAVIYVMIYRSSGVVNFAQGIIILSGGCIFFSLMSKGLFPTGLGIIAVLISGGILGLVIERLCVRPLFGQSPMAVMMLTLGLFILLEGLLHLGWGFRGQWLAKFIPLGSINFGIGRLGYEQAIALTFSLFIMAGLLVFYKLHPMGLMMTSIADDQVVASSVGVNINRISMLTWILGCAVSGVAGILLASILGISLSIGDIGLRGIVAFLAGGMESLPGGIIMGLALGILEGIASGYIDPHVGGGFKDIFAFMVMIAFVLFKPYGLFGWKRIERV
jgi:branched-chain amino acid transport system permease protein